MPSAIRLLRITIILLKIIFRKKSYVFFFLIRICPSEFEDCNKSIDQVTY